MVDGEGVSRDEEVDLDLIDTEQVSIKKYQISCCRSYLTPKGRCYTCPQDEE